MMKEENRNTPIKVGLLGPAFGTGNLGVDALTESCLKTVFHCWPNAEVSLLGSTKTRKEYKLHISGKDVTVTSIPIRFCRNIFLSEHFLVHVFYLILFWLFRSPERQKRIASGNRYVKTFFEIDIIGDITGGDSFGDIYGWKRFLSGFMRKWLCKAYGKKLILLPQTYGPFNSRLSKKLARSILYYASAIYTRDPQGISYLRHIIGDNDNITKTRFMPDVAFILDAQEPDKNILDTFKEMKKNREVIVGLNISGMILRDFQNNYKRFGLGIDYPLLIKKIIGQFMDSERMKIVLIPHTTTLKEGSISPKDKANKTGYELADGQACALIYEQVKEKYPGRILMVSGNYNHKEIKYIIGLCDFFIGSRMHSCIAALSQRVPTVGCAYSKKFEGVFESVGTKENVLDLRHLSEDEILKSIGVFFEERHQIKKKLDSRVPKAQSRVLNLFIDHQKAMRWL